jgi:hypothetical protein
LCGFAQQRISKVQPLKLMDTGEWLGENPTMQPRHSPGDSISTGMSQEGMSIFFYNEQWWSESMAGCFF